MASDTSDVLISADGRIGNLIFTLCSRAVIRLGGHGRETGGRGDHEGSCDHSEHRAPPLYGLLARKRTPSELLPADLLDSGNRAGTGSPASNPNPAIDMASPKRSPCRKAKSGG
jgi:hypothetical protein